MDTPAARILTPKYRAKRKVRLEVDGELREVKKGDLVPLDDPIAVVAPDGFEKVSVES